MISTVTPFGNTQIIVFSSGLFKIFIASPDYLFPVSDSGVWLDRVEFNFDVGHSTNTLLYRHHPNE